ncbi:MAG: hypothetical protein EP336_01475 [Rhodobacteraceae bacterium]|nr:MAG: hypothetical protein EP336_01475 [Paracoccaceae bacterium]
MLWRIMLPDKEDTGEKMANRYGELTDVEIGYVREWVGRYDIGEIFTFSGWKAFFQDKPEAPAATKIGGQVVEALEKEQVDPRLDFIRLTKGPGKKGAIGDKKSDHAQYYIRIK